MNRYKLSKAGIDANEGIQRFNNNKEMYEKFLMSFVNDELFGKLKQAIVDQDVEAAFQAAHALKGVSGNLSLTDVYKNIYPLVEELRGKSMEHASELILPVEESYQKVIEVLQQSTQE